MAPWQSPAWPLAEGTVLLRRPAVWRTRHTAIVAALFGLLHLRSGHPPPYSVGLNIDYMFIESFTLVRSWFSSEEPLFDGARSLFGRMPPPSSRPPTNEAMMNPLHNCGSHEDEQVEDYYSPQVDQKTPKEN